MQECSPKGILILVISPTKRKVSLSSVHVRWSDFEVEAGVREVNMDCFIDLVAEKERDTSVLILQLRVMGIIHEISFQGGIIGDAKGFFKKCAILAR